MSIKHILGLDLGITSCGWAVTSYDDEYKQEPWLDDFGVRLFEEPADSKTRVSNATARRMARSSRRLKRRRKNRLEELKNLLETSGIISKKDINDFYNPKISNIYSTNLIGADSKKYFNPYEIRVKGLSEKLSPIELAIVIIHITKHRGYENLFDQEKGEDNSLIEDNLKLDPVKDNYQYSILEARRKIGFNRKENSIDKTVAQLVLDLDETSTKLGDSKNLINFRNNAKLVLKNGKMEKKSNYKFLFPRSVFKIELVKILNYQSNFYNQINNDLINKICEISFRQRDFEDGFGSSNLKDLKHDDKINKLIEKYNSIPESKLSFKRAIKLEIRSFKQFKPFTELTGMCTLYKDQKRYIKSSVVFDIYQMAVEVSKFSSMFDDENERQRFNDVLFRKIFTDVKFVKDCKKEIKNVLKKQFGFTSEDINANKAFENVIGKLLPFLNKILDAIGDNKYLELMDNGFDYQNHIFNDLGDLLNKNITPRRRENEIKKWSDKYEVKLSQEMIEKFSIFSSSITTTSRLSKNAMQDVITEFLKGKVAGLVQDQMLRENVDVKISKFLEPFKDPDITRNPVVYRALNETRKVLKALFKRYGEFEKINIETTRELGIGKKELDKINKNQKNDLDRNLMIRDFLEKNNIKDNFTNRLKAKLWIDQDKKCIYSLREIPIEYLKSDLLEIDHIIPKSIFPDDSYNNKVLVYASENQEKSNRIPIVYLQENHPERIKDYKKYVDGLYRKGNLNYSKYENLKRINLNDDDVRGFISRNLNDTSYITTYIRNWLQKNIEMQFPNKTSKTVQAIKGKITSNFRRFWLRNSGWGLDEKVREITPWHHAVDAIVLSQFLNEGEITFAQDAIALKQLTYLKNRNEKEFNNDKEQILKKWNSDSGYIWSFKVKDALLKLEKIIENKSINYIYPKVPNLVDVIEKRMPVILEVKEIEEVHKIKKIMSEDENKKTIEKPIEEKEIKIYKKIPIFSKVLMPEEYMDKINQLNLKGNIHYPCVSYLQSMRIRGNFTKKQNPIKQSSDIVENNMVNENNKEKYYIDNKGTMWDIRKYLGVYLNLQNSKNSLWIKKIDAQTRKVNFEKRDGFLYIKKYDIISYLEKDTNKKIYKWFRSKKNKQILINFVNTAFTSDNEKSKRIFGKQNYYGTLDEITRDICIHPVSILGYLRF